MKVALYKLAHGVLRAELDGQAVLLHPDTGIYHLLNSSGRTILDRLEDDCPFETAIAELAASSGESEEVVGADARSFVDAMLDRRLLAYVPGT